MRPERPPGWEIRGEGPQWAGRRARQGVETQAAGRKHRAPPRRTEDDHFAAKQRRGVVVARGRRLALSHLQLPPRVGCQVECPQVPGVVCEAGATVWRCCWYCLARGPTGCTASLPRRLARVHTRSTAPRPCARPTRAAQWGGWAGCAGFWGQPRSTAATQPTWKPPHSPSPAYHLRILPTSRRQVERGVAAPGRRRVLACRLHRRQLPPGGVAGAKAELHLPHIIQQGLVLRAPSKQHSAGQAVVALGGEAAAGQEAGVAAPRAVSHTQQRAPLVPPARRSTRPRTQCSMVEWPRLGSIAGSPGATAARCQRRLAGSRRQASLLYEWRRVPGMYRSPPTTASPPSTTCGALGGGLSPTHLHTVADPAAACGGVPATSCAGPHLGVARLPAGDGVRAALRRQLAPCSRGQVEGEQVVKHVLVLAHAAPHQQLVARSLAASGGGCSIASQHNHAGRLAAVGDGRAALGSA